jgi:hypothetical protein
MLFVAAEGAHAAEKISLSCSGTFASKETGFENTPSLNQSLLIDLDQGVVTGSPGEYEIFKVSETSIAFRAQSSDPTVRSIVGGVDRVSGAASVTAWLDDSHVRYIYQLNCKRTNPLF